MYIPNCYVFIIAFKICMIKNVVDDNTKIINNKNNFLGRPRFIHGRRRS